ncbi:MAG: hypothetical protein CMK07_10240 [Ponticaulis sp.]|nr:hypothetical protein [Ponticaulis sp.]
MRFLKQCALSVSLVLGVLIAPASLAQNDQTAWKAAPPELASALKANWARVNATGGSIDLSGAAEACVRSMHDVDRIKSADMWGTREAKWNKFITAIPEIPDLKGDLSFISDATGVVLIYNKASDRSMHATVQAMDSLTYLETGQTIMVQADNNRRFSSFDSEWTDLSPGQTSRPMLMLSGTQAPNGSQVVTMAYPVSETGLLPNTEYFVRCPN